MTYMLAAEDTQSKKHLTPTSGALTRGGITVSTQREEKRAKVGIYQHNSSTKAGNGWLVV